MSATEVELPAGPRIDERIARHQDHLSPQEQRAAATLLEHLDDLATYRASELADMAGVSKATMSRLFRSLGFAGFDEVRDHLRSLRSAGEPRSVDEGGTPAEQAESDASAIAVALGQPSIARAVELLADADRVLVVGWRNGHVVALHLRQQLAQVRPDVRLAPLPGQVVGEELADLGPRDVVVLMGFRRRPRGFSLMLEQAGATGAGVVLVADPTAAGHAPAATVFLECPVHSGLAFDSYAAAMSLVSVLADGVLRRVGRAGSERTARISRAYQDLREVE